MTAQTPERLLYKGQDLAMCSEPLEQYFSAFGARAPNGLHEACLFTQAKLRVRQEETSMFLKTSDADLFISDYGRVDGEPIVAHGGWVGSGELWAQPFEQLSRRRRCITYDHRGTGATRHRGGRITYDVLADDLFRVLDALKVERCIIAGESAGGLTVLQAVKRAPERFTGIVLVGARYQGGPLTEGAKKLIAGCRTDFPATMQAFVNACIPEPDCEAEREWALKIVMRSNATQAAELLENAADVDLTVDDLNTIRVPTLLIHGDKDVIRPVSDSEFMHSRISGSRLVKMEGIGHVPIITRPMEVAAEIDDFFGVDLANSPPTP